MLGSLFAKPKAKAMRMNFGEVLDIKDLGKHSAGTVIHLGIVLAGSVDVTPDPKRKNFYEVEGGATVYYIYVSPATGTISLIAAWENVPQLCTLIKSSETDLGAQGLIGRASYRLSVWSGPLRPTAGNGR